MTSIDLNCDMGELLPGQEHNYDAEIMPFISSCNIACGFHSGSPLLMEKTIRLAMKYDVQMGAHPSYHDRANFGRQSLQSQLPLAEILADCRYQIVALKGMVESLGGHLTHVKPHGALYNDMAKDEQLASAVIEVIKSIDPRLKVFGLAHSAAITACEKSGITAVAEGFADRRYEARDQLRSRQYPDAVLHSQPDINQQLDGFLRGKTILASGQNTAIQIDSLCLHSDTPGAVQLSRHIFQYLIAHGVHIQAI